MLYLQVCCDKCDRTIVDETANCADDLIYQLKKVDQKNDTGDEILCEECLIEHDASLEKEDLYQTDRS